jgi:hypothetical protein
MKRFEVLRVPHCHMCTREFQHGPDIIYKLQSHYRRKYQSKTNSLRRRRRG